MALPAQRQPDLLHARAATAHPDVPQAPARDALPEVLYVMGTGRSGTTILEIMLANNPGMAGVGEVKHIFRDGFLADHVCSCGQPVSQCELWSEVRRATGWTREDCAQLGAAVEQLESHKRFALTYAGLGNEAATQAYLQGSRELFCNVARVRGCRVIVDSSKFAGRALLLSRALPERVKVLCITRSAAGLLKAFSKPNEGEQRPKGPLAASAYYLYVLACMRLVKWRLKHRCFAIRFEELNRDPRAVLTQIENWSGYSLEASRARIAAGQPFDVGHIVTGNRLRKKGQVKFEPGNSAGGKLSSALARMLAPLLETYRRVLGF